MMIEILKHDVRNAAMKVLQIFILLTTLCTVSAGSAPDFRDLGMAVPVSENRGLVSFRDATGRHLAIALADDVQSTRGYLFFIDLDSGTVEQIFYPEGVKNVSAFASMLSKNGRFYTGAGPVLLEFDPGNRRFLYYGIPNPNADLFVDEAFADGPDGRIYIGTYPDCRLMSFDPKTKMIKDFGRLDTNEKYFSYLIFDSMGWGYAGIGTARCNIVAFNPQTGERRQILDERERFPGTPYLFLGNDGKVYGVANKKYYRLFDGKGERIEQAGLATKVSTGAINWTVDSVKIPDGRMVRLNLPEHYIELDYNGTKKSRIPVKFTSGGAQISSLITGPDGYIYGSSAHPMHFFRYKIASGSLSDLGAVKGIGGGNFPAMAVQGQYVAAASYSNGILHIFDTKKPFNGGYGDQPNPWEVAVWSKDIARPRACIAHPDGHTVLMAGFAGYGLSGGGMGMYDLSTKKTTLFTHNDLIPNESTIAMRALPNGNIICGTSVEAPGGGRKYSTSATLYIFDWKTKKVIFKIKPLPSTREIISLELGADGMVYGLGSDSKLFVFNPNVQKVIYYSNLAQYGSVPRQALVSAAGKLYALLTKALLSIEPNTYKVIKETDMPDNVTIGAVYADEQLYFARGSHLWSYDLKLK